MIIAIIRRLIANYKEKKKQRIIEKQNKLIYYAHLNYLRIYEPGKYAEYEISMLLKSKILPGSRELLTNVYIPYRGKTAEIDIIMIHEKGIYVFESKNYSGWIFGSENQYKWTQTLNKNSKNHFYNPIKQNETHIKALSEYLKIGTYVMYSYIVFSDKCSLKSVPENTSKYKIVKKSGLITELMNDIQNKTLLFLPEDINEIYNSLLPLTQVSEEVKQNHINNIKQQVK